MGIFTKNGFGDDFRLMTRVLPRPLVFQGGKSFDKPKEYKRRYERESCKFGFADVWSVFLTCPRSLLWGGGGGDDIFIIFMIKRGDIIFDKSSTFIENGTGHDIRLMSRVLPRPIVLQGGKLMGIQSRLKR